ncbi:glycosyltransferase family 1 protein [Streptodolium elevatio]
MLDPGWVTAHHHEFDIYHLHFGFDAQTPEALRELVGTLRRHGKPLVYTVHDLRNPHHRDRSAHDSALDVIVPAADELITLTPGAAREIQGRWGRTPTVLPHPHVVDLRRMARPRPSHAQYTIGVHAKSLRPNMDVLPTVRALTSAVAGLPSTFLRVDVHRDVEDPDAPAYAPDLIAELRHMQQDGRVDLRVHDYFDDDELWDYLQELDLSVLPYAFGTHSGWLEACADLGTAVAVSDCGYYAEQRPCHSFRLGVSDGDPLSLSTAVNAAYHGAHSVPGPSPDERAAERRGIAEAHRRIYESALR